MQTITSTVSETSQAFNKKTHSRIYAPNIHLSSVFTLWFFVVQRASPAVIRIDLLEFSHISLSRPPLTPLRPPCCIDRYIFQLVYTCAHSHKTLGGPEQIDGDNELGQCELVGLSRLHRGKVTLKMKILSFAHPHFIINMYDLLSFAEWVFFSRFWCCFGPHWLSLYEQKNTEHFSKYFFHVPQKTESHTGLERH